MKYAKYVNIFFSILILDGCTKNGSEVKKIRENSDIQISGPDEGAKYPRRAERENIAGYAVVAFTVNESGDPENILILQEEPNGYDFGFSAKNAVRKLKFKPAILNNSPVKQSVKRRYNFDAKNQGTFKFIKVYSDSGK